MFSRKKRFQFIGAFHDVLAHLSLLLKQDTLRLCPTSVILYLPIYITFFLLAHDSALVHRHLNTCLRTEVRSRKSSPSWYSTSTRMWLPLLGRALHEKTAKQMTKKYYRLRHSVRNRPPNAPNLRYANLLHPLQPTTPLNSQFKIISVTHRYSWWSFVFTFTRLSH